MRNALLLSWIVLSSVGVRSQEDYDRALSIEMEVRRIASQRTLWPGFDPLRIPLAIFTGKNTYLFRHPSPPAEFSKQEDAHIFRGRYPLVTSNTSIDINGTLTATLMAERGDATTNAAASLHEAFHVYQQMHHPHWIANEGSVFLYPTDNANLLTLRRLESVALGRALRADDIQTAAGWTDLALQYRVSRYGEMDSAFAAYERFNELNEGLAQTIQLLAAGQNSVDFPAEEFKPAAIRERVYVSGPALAFLLDRFDPGWQMRVEKDDRQFLDELLRRAITGRRIADCRIDTNEIHDVRGVAQTDVQDVIQFRSDRRRTFDGRPGWHVSIVTGTPLWPRGFDPLNVSVIDGGILHTRFLQLGNDSCGIQMLDGSGADVEALTVAAGRHPLFHGVSEVTLTGLERPHVQTEGARIRLSAPGFQADIHGGKISVEETGKWIRVTVGP